MKLDDRIANMVAVPPEPFALVVGRDFRAADAGRLEQAIRHLGLRPERLDAVEEMTEGRVVSPGFRLRLGQLEIVAGPAGPASLDFVNPGNSATSSLAASLPDDWRDEGCCWQFWPVGGTADGAPQRTSGYFQMMSLAIDLFEASHFFWAPARLWSDAQQFRASVGEMLRSGMPPVLHLVAFRRRDAGDGASALTTRGLASFSGQELDARLPQAWTVADGVRRLARLAIDMILHGPFARSRRVSGMEEGETIKLLPDVGGGSDPQIVRVIFETPR